MSIRSSRRAQCRRTCCAWPKPYVFASPNPVTARTLALLLPEGQNAYVVLEALQARCARCGVVLAEADGTWVFRTAPDFAERHGLATAPPRRLLRVAMEVLALIALHQPVTRPQIEAVRGVSPGPVSIDVLLNAGLIRPVGRREASGRPTLRATTARFLARFGLRSMHDLPGAGLPLPTEAGRAGEKPVSPQTAEACLAVPTALVRPDWPPSSPRPKVVFTRDKRGYRARRI